ncbi:uncharacterized protein ARMOST_15930 [Armillaria ostoyae]|uniref:DUF6535 domain-containing protein n=1 Tax=Armillaria ostoyae TaxID=47428 RepID=A0A284RUS9_ARMOS|nr:uncharacterized protein ARMOST_15930 [Armillaria ostoyae]
MTDNHENGAEAPMNQPSARGDNVRSTAILEDPGAQRNPSSGTFFGLNKNQLRSWGVGATPRNYKARYPPDPYGQEMSDNAQIWPIYLEEAADFDANMLAEWRDTIDVLLVFAGLFSVVLTTFVTQTSQNMQPNYNQASTLILFEILKATASNGSQISIPSSPTAFFSPGPSSSDEWINSLWFVSLTLSLITALVAVLVKQWLHQYVAIVSDSSARDRARIRHMRYAGLQAWQVPMIIGILPVLLHVSLALFFAGLAVFLFSLGMKVAWLVSIIGVATYMAYIIALILPVVYPYCPFKVPLTLYVHPLYQFISDSLIPRIVLIRQYPYSHVFGRDRDNSRLDMYRQRRESIFQRRKRPLKEIEYDHVQKWAANVDAQSLQWLYSSTSNASVHQSVLQACSGMTFTTLKCLPNECVSTFVVSLRQQIERIDPLVSSPGAEREFELCCRAYILLCPDFQLSSDRARMADQCSNEQLKMVLCSMTSPKKACTGLLGILRGPQRSSLTLHAAVWMALFDAGIPIPPRRGTALKLELELMKIIVRPLSKRESGEVTTIDKPTDEMREYIRGILSGFRPPRIKTSTATSFFALDLNIILTLIFRMEQILCKPAHASERKQLIETSITIIECTGILWPNLVRSGGMTSVLAMLSWLLASDAFDVVSPDLRTLAHKILKIFSIPDKYWQYWMKNIFSGIRFYSVAYQCYLHSPAGGGESSEKDVMPRALGRLISSSLNLPPALSMDDSESHETPFNPLHYPLFSIDGLFQVMLLLIKEHHESVLYKWARHPAMQNVWPECLSRLVRWASGDEFRQWDLLKRVLAIVVIGDLQNILGHSDEYESLPQYDYDVYKDVERLLWLHEIGGSSSDGEHNAVEYAQAPSLTRAKDPINMLGKNELKKTDTKNLDDYDDPDYVDTNEDTRQVVKKMVWVVIAGWPLC